MPIIAYCRDGPDALRLREEAFEAHSYHILGLFERLSLACPLALADGAEVVGDGQLVASLLVFAEDDLASVHDALLQDPYMQSGAWERADLFRTQALYGAWGPDPEGQRRAFAGLAEVIDPVPPGARSYAIFCRGAGSEAAAAPLQLEHGRYVARLFDRMQLGAGLEPAGSIGRGAPAEAWRALYLYQAQSLQDADRLARDDPFEVEGLWRTTTFAIPAAVGAWVTAP